MKRKLLFLMVVIPTLMCLFAFASSAKITIYAGADSSTEATEYEASSITLTGNTEAKETVTVYFTDDGRAWKAGETVTFTEDTNLYTIECTKISNHTEYGNAAGEGNYILVNDIDLTKGGGKIGGDNCTTRLFMNGKTVNLGNGDRPMFGGNSHSFYLLGQGEVTSAWGGGIYRGHCKNKVDVVWFIGKDVTVHSNKDGGSFIYIWNNIGCTSLNVHIYGTVAKPTTGNVGTWDFIACDNNNTDYNIYFHDGSSIELVGYLIKYVDTSTAGIGSITFDGADVKLETTNYFSYNKGVAIYDGTLTINGGTFNIANADSRATFKSKIEEDKKALDINSTSFKVVCKECSFEMTLEGFEGLTSDFVIVSACPNCNTKESKNVAKVFEAAGYSIKEGGSYGIIAGYQVNKQSLEEYEKYLKSKGKTLEFGVFVANAGEFGNNSFISSNGTLGTTYGYQTKVSERDHDRVTCTVTDFTANETNLQLVMALYVIEDGVVTYIQRDGQYASTATQGGATLNVVTFEKVAELLGKTDIDILTPAPANLGDDEQ